MIINENQIVLQHLLLFNLNRQIQFCLVFCWVRHVLLNVFYCSCHFIYKYDFKMILVLMKI